MLNSSSNYVIQLDSENRYFRCFLSTEIIVDSVHLNVTNLGTDGAHSKISHYNGVFLSLVGVDGHFENIDVGFAIVHKETYRLLFNCAAKAGLRWDQIILYTDR
jgi:hypothetical protein